MSSTLFVYVVLLLFFPSGALISIFFTSLSLVFSLCFVLVCQQHYKSTAWAWQLVGGSARLIHTLKNFLRSKFASGELDSVKATALAARNKQKTLGPILIKQTDVALTLPEELKQPGASPIPPYGSTIMLPPPLGGAAAVPPILATEDKIRKRFQCDMCGSKIFL